MSRPIIPENRPSFYTWCALVLAVTLLAFVACTGSSKEAATTPAATEPAPTPTPVPADLALARSYERNGQYDEADAAYVAVVAQGSAADRQEARIGLARLSLDDGDFQSAYDQISAVQATGGDGSEADFLLARALAGLGDAEGALQAYQRYVGEGGVASASAQAEMASVLLSLDRVDEAQQEAEAALSGLPESLRPGVIFSVALSLEESDYTAAAIDWYQRLFDESDSDSDKALALQKIGLLKRASDPAGSQEDLQTVIARYPITAAALDALSSLLGANVPVEPYVEAVVYYRHFENDEAMQAFRGYLDASPDGLHAAAAHYYIAAIDERLGDDDSALQEYARSLEIDPSGDLADDALWWSGLILEKRSRWEEASDAYGRILLFSRVSEWAEDAGFRQGMVLYKQERYLEAANAWRSFATGAYDETATHAFFWAAKAELAAGDTMIGTAHLRELAQGWPLDYYGLRAAALLSEMDDKATPLPAPESNDSDVESWLAAAIGRQPVALWSVWLDSRWSRGQELLSVGFPRSAAAEFRDLMWANSGDPMALWALARSYRMLGLTEMSARSAQLILEKLSPEERLEAPRALLRLAYPQDYMGLLESAKDSEGVSPNVMLALMRQESWFDPLAGSGAGATGLTQVIQPTGEEIAGDLGVGDFVNEDLLRPVVSVRFGAHYLEKQLAAFDGNLYYALAAYNAGPGAAERWREAAGDDVDLFLEQVDIGEANLYVRLVMQNLAMYRYLYEGAARPSLPQ
jgi:soluble lytic murein transglycosylase